MLKSITIAFFSFLFFILNCNGTDIVPVIQKKGGINGATSLNEIMCFVRSDKDHKNMYDVKITIAKEYVEAAFIDSTTKDGNPRYSSLVFINKQGAKNDSITMTINRDNRDGLNLYLIRKGNLESLEIDLSKLLPNDDVEKLQQTIQDESPVN